MIGSAVEYREILEEKSSCDTSMVEMETFPRENCQVEQTCLSSSPKCKSRLSPKPEVTRSKISRELGMSDKEIVAHEYLQGINPKVWDVLGSKATVDDVQLSYGVRMTVLGQSEMIEPPRFVKLGKTMGMSADEMVSYDYIQTINPKVFDRTFGSRPSPSDITAPARFKPRTLKETKTKKINKPRTTEEMFSKSQ